MKRKYTSLPYTEETVADGNYETVRKPITKIVIHTTVGTKEAAIARFGKLGSQVSAHYLVTWEGELIAFLEEYNTAYHCGNYGVNQESIGIEHEDNGNYTAARPDTLYETSAKLVADICRFYNIPCDKQHILKHNEIVATGCPHNLDIDRIIRRANEILNPQPQPPPDDQKLANEFRKLQQCEYASGVWYKSQNVLDWIRARLSEKQQVENAVKEKEITIKNLNSQIGELEKEKNRLAEDLKVCQKEKESNKESTDKLIKLQEEHNQLKLDHEQMKGNWQLKEVEYQKQIKYYKTRLEAFKSPIKKLVVDIWQTVVPKT